MDPKAQHERSVFLDFVKAANLSIDEASVKVCRGEREPDIWCLCEGQPAYFELTRLLDPEMQTERLKVMQASLDAARPGRPPPQVPLNLKVRLPEHDTLRKKLAKKYATGGTFLDIVLYYDAEDWLRAGFIPLPTAARHAKFAIEPLLTPMPSHIRRVWLFERYRNSLLWCHPLGRVVLGLMTRTIA
ncbi:MAG: hypothetical protein ACJ8C9_16900 [Microvirga sp.]|jgi:hypothetical protein